LWFSRLSVDLLWGIIAQFFYGEKKNGRLQKNISSIKDTLFGNFDGEFMFHVKHGGQTSPMVFHVKHKKARNSRKNFWLALLVLLVKTLHEMRF